MGIPFWFKVLAKDVQPAPSVHEHPREMSASDDQADDEQEVP